MLEAIITEEGEGSTQQNTKSCKEESSGERGKMGNFKENVRGNCLVVRALLMYDA